MLCCLKSQDFKSIYQIGIHCIITCGRSVSDMQCQFLTTHVSPLTIYELFNFLTSQDSDYRTPITEYRILVNLFLIKTQVEHVASSPRLVLYDPLPETP